MLSNWVLSLRRGQKTAILILLDLALVPLSLFLTLVLFDPALLSAALANPTPLTVLVVMMTLSGGTLSLALGLPRIKLNAYEQSGILRTAAFAVLVAALGWLALRLAFDGVLNARMMVVFAMVLILLSVSARIALRGVLVGFYRRGQSRERILIYGAGQTGVQLAAALGTDETVEPIAFVDDNPMMHKVNVAGLPVLASIRLEDVIREKRIDRVVLAMPTLSPPRRARIARNLSELSCKVSTLPSFASLVGQTDILDRIEPVNPSDYLNREGHENALPSDADIYCGKTIMITGAGGSIGAELTRQVLRCRPARLVLYEISELALYQIDRELSEIADGIEVVPVLGSVADPAGVRRALVEHGVNIVLHAAAYKHVFMVERNLLAGLRNNVIGTKTVAAAAVEAGVDHFILISTDKAVRPTNVMGASKRFAEQIIQDLATRSASTKFAMVRFGNVLGSSGSVVPLFQEQIERGGPVTLTHAEVTRFFMTLSEAARLVLVAGGLAGTSGDGTTGEVFVLDMGAPVPIRRLAEQMIKASGYSVCDATNPDGDIEIAITGLRPGEKLHEELTTEGHALDTTAHPKILLAREPMLSQIEIASALRDLTSAIEAGDETAARDVVSHWIGALPKMPLSISETSTDAL